MPQQVDDFIGTLMDLPGIEGADIGKQWVDDIAIADLSLPAPYADLPIASLRRTEGGLPDELLMSINFTIRRDETGLKALEFMAWWTRDQSRGGENMQLRAIGLPPIAGDDVQLGNTLRFTIDWFYNDPAQDIGRVLKALADANADLTLAVNLYRDAFN